MRPIRNALLLLLCLASLAAQTPATGSVRGSLVRWGTAEPVGQATVELRGVSSDVGSPVSITATQDTGEFVFTNVAPGTYRIFAMAAGFAGAEFGQLRPNGTGRPVTIAPGQQVSLRMGVIQGGIISGRVTDQNGAPVVYSPVRILKVAYSAEGWLEPELVLSVTTNDLGEYSITDWPDSTPFPLARVRVITILATTRLGTDPEQRARGVMTYVTDGRFEGAAAPGVFQIRATQGEFSGRAIIDVGNRDLDVTVPLRPLTSVAGRIVVEETTSDALNLSGLQVVIRTAPSTPFAAAVGPDGSFRIERVIVGDYRVYVPPLAPAPAAASSAPPAAALPPAFENAYVKAIRAGGADVTNGLLRVEGADPADPADAVEIVLNLRGASIEGRALNSRGEAVSQATVVLLPEGQPPFRPDRQRTFTTNETGRFQFRGLPPGEYRVLAWEDVDAGAWFNPSFLSSYESGAIRVLLAEGEHRDLAVSVIPAAP